MKNNIEKENRKKYLLLEPLEIDVTDIKEFDNVVDFQRFITKHWNSLSYYKIEYYIITEEDDDDNLEYKCCYLSGSQYDSFDDAISDIIVQTANTIKEHGVTVHWHHTRLENRKELEKRQQLISNLSRYSTQQLLNAKRIGYYADDGCPLTSKIRLAILDTREHVLRSAERKKIRQMKAKLQKTR